MAEMFNAARVDQAANLYKRQKLDRQKQELDIQNAERDAQEQELIRQSAKAAVDPATGQYSLQRHTQALERAGYPDLAMKYREKSMAIMTSAYQALDKALAGVNEQNYADIRRQLIAAGMPEQAVPAQFNAGWLQAQHRRLGTALDRYGAMEKVADGPDGKQLWGQKNLDTGQLSNVREMSPNRPYASSGGGGRGGYAPSNREKVAQFYAQTYRVPIEVALDIVRNEESGEGPFKLFARLSNTLLGTYASPEEAAAYARQIVEDLYGVGSIDLATRPGRPLATDSRRQHTGIPRGASGSWKPAANEAGMFNAEEITRRAPGGFRKQEITRPSGGTPPDSFFRSLIEGPDALQENEIAIARNGTRWMLKDGQIVQVVIENGQIKQVK